MNNKRTYIILLLFLFFSVKLFAQEDPFGGEPTDPGGALPIPGVIYFFVALLGIGIKKLYHGRKKD